MTDRITQAIRQRHPMERFLFGVSATGSVLLFIVALIALVFGGPITEAVEAGYIEEYREHHPEAADLPDEEILPVLPAENRNTLDTLSYLPLLILFPIGFFALFLVTTGRAYGKHRADGVRITPEQFPEVYAIWKDLAETLGMQRTPELYSINGNGLINAFASCVPGFRYFSVVYSDILEACLRNEDWDALRFILGHEMGHMRLGHVRWWYSMLTMLGNIPPLSFVIGLPMSRAREYGCDRIGHAVAQDETYGALLMLTAGKRLYNQIDRNAHIAETVAQGGFWITIHNLTVGHPILAWRINALRRNHHGGIFRHRA